LAYVGGGKKNLAGFAVARQTKVSLGSEDIFVSRSKPGLPDFSLHSVPKQEKYSTKSTEWPSNISNAQKYTNYPLNTTTSSIANPKNFPNWDFLV
jgi:hypothetical protein